MRFILKLDIDTIRVVFSKHVSNHISNLVKQVYEETEDRVRVVPDTRRIKDGKRFPLKLRITYRGGRAYYSIGHNATRKEWKNY